MMRIEKPSGFSPARQFALRPVVPAPRPVVPAPAPRRLEASHPVLAQAVLADPELREIGGFLSEAREQLAAIERSYVNLAIALGQAEADLAVAQARATVEMYEAAYVRAGGA